MANFDITVDGVKARIMRGEGGYKERSIRAEVTQNLLSQAEGLGMSSRPDQPSLYQTDWSGGSRWWKPIIKGDEQTSYFTSLNLDLWSEPGKVVPLNTFDLIDNAFDANWSDDTPPVVHGSNLYALQTSDNVAATHFDVGIWTPGSENFVDATTYYSGVNADSDEGAMAWVSDPSDGYIYVITHDSEITRFSPAGATTSPAWIATGFTASEGANIFLQNGFLMFYSGDQVYTISKSGTASVESVFNDGMGRDALEDRVNNGPAMEPQWRQLAISTPEGIYYVKNTRQGGQHVAWIFRVDRDAAGNWIGNPLGTLPVGELALHIGYHMGSVMFSTLQVAVGTAALGSTSGTINIYHMTQGSLGALGSPNGKFATSGGFAHTFLGSIGPYLYIGGDALWVYDAVRGGLHRITTGSNFLSMSHVTDSDGDNCVLFLPIGQLYKVEMELDPDIVSAFGDDEANYTLESNYFDMNLPLETKEITKVALMADAATTASRQEWTLQISTDDGAFADVLVHSGTAQYAEATISAGTHRGRLFRYKLIYQTKDAIKRALRAVFITANSGQMVREWEVVLDGTSLLNVENEPVHPAEFAESMRAVMVKEEAITVAIDYQTEVAKQVTDTAESITAKVMACEIAKENPDESMISLVFREV